VNPQNNAGMPPKEWWKNWEPTTLTPVVQTSEISSDNEPNNCHEDIPATIST